MHHCHAKITQLIVDIGVVITWQLCKGTNFDEVKNLLMGLNDHFKDHKNENLESVFLDNCCHWKKKVESILGKVPKKLDCFDAIQRFVSTLPRKNVTAQLKILRNQMIRSFKLVIRDSTDTGKKRQKTTPNPQIIEKNIDNFLRQWGNIQTNEIQVLPKLSCKAIENLLVHMRLRYLSFIPVPGGTSRNECLNKVLNKTLRKQKIGVQVAVALLGNFFYKWNERKENYMTNVVMSVESHFLSNHSLFQTTERSGVKDISFEKEKYASYQIGSDSSALSFLKRRNLIVIVTTKV